MRKRQPGGPYSEDAILTHRKIHTLGTHFLNVRTLFSFLAFMLEFQFFWRQMCPIQTGVQRPQHTKHSEELGMFRFLISGWTCWNFSPTKGEPGPANIPAEIQAAWSSGSVFMSRKERPRWVRNSPRVREGPPCSLISSSQMFTDHSWLPSCPVPTEETATKTHSLPPRCSQVSKSYVHDNTSCPHYLSMKGYGSTVHVAAQVSRDSGKTP